MLVLEYKVKAKPKQYQAIADAIRTVQFIRNKSIRYWMDASRDAKINYAALSRYSTELRNEFKFVKDLNSMAVQAAAERGWFAISRFYDNCKSKKPGKKGFPRFQKDNRSVEYKTSGWKLHPTKRRITITDKKGLVAYEDLRTRNMVKCHNRAKSISDASWYQFRLWIEHFAKKFGKSAIAVAPYNTSQQCCVCKQIVPKTLKDRIHSCECGCKIHRDINAAINILLKAKSREGHSRSNALGVGTSTLLGLSLSKPW